MSQDKNYKVDYRVSKDKKMKIFEIIPNLDKMEPETPLSNLEAKFFD